ncbi:hypothetical protein XELAEV_18041824mg [Xenopus laevis]|uniref:Uncharacterized protein n=1 Tax=Xenopus laevis TaxID=8355 RepID=A0A974C3I9_XENLA|nr:hypothetical protein XELAEV_18041824mg [Xenopus laevis]
MCLWSTTLSHPKHVPLVNSSRSIYQLTGLYMAGNFQIYLLIMFENGIRYGPHHCNSGSQYDLVLIGNCQLSKSHYDQVVWISD